MEYRMALWKTAQAMALWKRALAVELEHLYWCSASAEAISEQPFLSNIQKHKNPPVDAKEVYFIAKKIV